MTVRSSDVDSPPTGAEVDEYLFPAGDVAPPPAPAAGDDVRPTGLAAFPAALGAAAEFDGVVGAVARVAATVAAHPAVRSVLQGEHLGHPLHPILTDVTIGFWTSASVLDVLGGRRARPAARTLVALGVLTMPLTAAAGLADFTEIRSRRRRRVAAVHAVGNVAVTGVYITSWWARRRGHHRLGALLALGGGAGAAATGYLGGHLVFGDEGDEGDEEEQAR